MRILILEDIAETRLWLSAVVETAFPGCTVQTEASLRGGNAAACNTAFDMALIDLGLPDGSGIEVLRGLKSARPETVCAVITVMGDDANIVAALAAGADGYFLKEESADQLCRQLVQLTDGVPSLSPSIARRIMEHFRLTAPTAGLEGNLTSREREVLSAIGKGLRNVEVAADLNMAESTVASHIKSIYRKLGISTRAEAAWHAVRLGLTVPSRES